MAVTQWSDFRVGDVVTVGKLHYDSLRKDKEPILRKGRYGIETIWQFHVEGKFRPCLILEVSSNCFRVWYATAHPKGDTPHIKLRGVQGLKEESFLEKVPEKIDWVHKCLLDKRIGSQDREANHYVMEELNQMILRAPK